MTNVFQLFFPALRCGTTRASEWLRMKYISDRTSKRPEASFIIISPAPEAYVRQKPIEIYPNDLETSKSRLFFVVDPSHLRHGILSLQCTASVSLVHSKSSIELIVNDGSSGAEFLHVPHVPPGLEGPSITGSVSRYYVGDTVDVNCSSARSLEPAQLQWFVNDKEAPKNRADASTTFPLPAVALKQCEGYWDTLVVLSECSYPGFA
ncbi:ig-like domain-containing protein [Trichonephila clavata]|uniref:Ig-like domain-containing protein n=1 Tax=Trichonephila clavata TaxID=2740835 RepID=A0A8X6LLG3_TRICU|nr:ig-like domain-containing protein [Trichonephila clavata]